MSNVIDIDRRRRRNLFTLLFFAARMVDDVSCTMSVDQYQWQRTLLGHNFSITHANAAVDRQGSASLINCLRTWLHTHENAQVMMASVLVVVGLWWLVRVVLTLIINIVCPLFVVLLAVVCVPQLRAPLLGQNYPALANLIRNILLKLAENIKQSN